MMIKRKSYFGTHDYKHLTQQLLLRGGHLGDALPPRHNRAGASLITRVLPPNAWAWSSRVSFQPRYGTHRKRCYLLDNLGKGGGGDTQYQPPGKLLKHTEKCKGPQETVWQRVGVGRWAPILAT